MPRYSSNSATPTGTYLTALKKHTWAPPTAATPYRSVGAVAARNVADERRSATTAGTASRSAARLSRAITTASGVHPASSSDVANDPEVPNVAADSSARPTPAALPDDGISHLL